MATYRILVNRISIIAVLLMIILSYSVWTIGLNNPITTFVYSNSSVLYTLITSLLVILNIPNFQLSDCILLALGIGSAVLYCATTDTRESTLSVNILFLVVISFVLIISKLQFNSLDRFLFLLVLSLILAITIYRIFTELPERVGERSIWEFNNKLSDIWINTNTIGFSLLTLGMLIVALLEYYYHFVARVLSLIVLIATSLSIYVTQSKASLLAMIAFVLMILIYKVLKADAISLFFFYVAQLLFALPLSVIAATSESVNLFTGREEIWADFYKQFFTNAHNILFGMKQFFFQRGENLLGYHNSYNNIIGIYGFVGLIIFATIVLIIAGRIILKYYLTPSQMTFFIAFFAILIQSYMEDTLVSFTWLPIVYFFLGFASQIPEENAEVETEVVDNYEPSFESRSMKHH